jgi:hypothetical protein
LEFRSQKPVDILLDIKMAVPLVAFFATRSSDF